MRIIIITLFIYAALCQKQNHIELQQNFSSIDGNNGESIQSESQLKVLRQMHIDSVKETNQIIQGILQKQLQQNRLVQSSIQAYILQTSKPIHTLRSLEEIKAIAKKSQTSENLNNPTPLQQQIVKEDGKGASQTIEPSDQSLSFIKITLEITILLFFSIVLLGCSIKVCRRKKYTEKFEQYPQRADSVQLEEEV